MNNLHLPFVMLPSEFVALLKSNLSVVTTPSPVFDIIRPNKALYVILEKAFQEFDDGRGLEKTMLALGWANFRERMASIYIYKKIYGSYPATTSMDLVEDVKHLEQRFSSFSIHGRSRLFLLGFYFKLVNYQILHHETNQFVEIQVRDEIGPLLKLSQGKTEKIDWLILILMHLLEGLGEEVLTKNLLSGKKFQELYELLEPEFRQTMLDNLLAYGASINESETFLYDKI